VRSPRSPHAVVRVAAIALAGIAITAAAVPTRLAPGLSFTIRSYDNTEGKTEGTPSSSTSVQSIGSTMRFITPKDADASKRNAYGDDSYTILNGTERRVLIVMPARKQFMEFKFENMDTLGIALQAAGASTVATDVKVSGESLGSGGSVNGYLTKHYRITTDYTLPFEGDANYTKKVHSVEEFWATDALKDIPDPTEAIAKFFGKASGPMAGSSGSLNDLMRRRAETQRKLFTGMPIKSTYRSTETLGDGTKHESGSTTEIVDLKKTDLDPALFRIPEGYTRVDLQAMMTDLGGQFKNALRGAGKEKAAAKAGAKGEVAAEKDTTSVMDAAKEGVKQGAKEAGKEEVKDKVNKKLKGWLKRP
jgi:hypothetical protein